MSEKKILVVDDEKTIRDLFEQAFSKAGYVVRSVESAEKALEILKEESIMVMFLDLNLPGISGMEMCKKIRKDNPVGIIYAVTGYADIFGLLECRKAGFDDLFGKPVNLGILLKAVEDAFEKIERWQLNEYDLT
jgi:DNA-binding NtrC family response regulator